MFGVVICCGVKTPMFWGTTHHNADHHSVTFWICSHLAQELKAGRRTDLRILDQAIRLVGRAAVGQLGKYVIRRGAVGRVLTERRFTGSVDDGY